MNSYIKPLLFGAMMTGLPLMLPTQAAGTTEQREYPIYEQAPSPETLADILFPPQHRSAEQRASGANKSQVFGMLIHFDFDSATIRAESETLLNSIGAMLVLPEQRARGVVIEGHTDAVGDKEYNLALSRQRAIAIKRFLTSQFGIDSARLVAVGKGEAQLYDATNPNAALNRRATFKPIRKLVLK